MVILPPESGKYLGVGVQLAGSFFLFTALGYWADKKLQSFPILTGIGAAIGIAAGFYNLYVQLRKRNDGAGDPK